MKALLLIIIATLVSEAWASDPDTNEWGSVSNGVHISICLDGGDREVKRNADVKLLVQMANQGEANASTYFAVAANSQPGTGLHCLIISPSGKDISPNVKSEGGSGAFINLFPGKIEKFTFDLSSICKFDEVGTYKITAQKIFHQSDGKKVVRSWTVISNPLQVKVVPAK